MIIGFSTGSLSKSNFLQAWDLLEDIAEVKAIELSALRESELPFLLEKLPGLLLTKYQHVSVHAPSKLKNLSETELIIQLARITQRSIPVVVHPDIISNYDLWRPLGEWLYIENMDKRKPVGRTANDMASIFDQLPKAGFCLDLAHAKQVDPTMVECAKMIRMFGSRIRQYHISDVTTDSRHVRINLGAILAYRKLDALINLQIPFIIESPVEASYITSEIKFIGSTFTNYSPNHQLRKVAEDSIYSPT